MPEDAVGCEPVSAPNSLLTGKLTGNLPRYLVIAVGTPEYPGALAQGVVWIQYRVENVHIVPVFGTGALNVSPRVGHLHIHVDDVPWWWADASDTNTIDIAGGCRPASTRC